MFKSSSNKITKKQIFGKVETLISQDTQIDGVIEASGTIRIDGTVKGGISRSGAVIIGDSGVIEGDIKSRGVTLAGKVKGNIYSENILELLPGSTLIGDIETTQLSIAEGAHFDGVCTMIDESKIQDSEEERLKDLKESPEEPT